MDLGNRPTLEPNFSSIYETHLNQTFLYHILVATYIKQRLSFLVLRKGISLPFYNKNILRTDNTNKCEKCTGTVNSSTTWPTFAL